MIPANVLKRISPIGLAPVLVLVAALVPAGARAQVHLSLFHPVSTNSDPDASANLALSVFQSRIGTLRGIGIHPVVSMVGGSVRGVQATGVYSRISGPLRGIALTGAITSVGGEVRGLQTAGLANFDGAGFRGIQISGVLNSVSGDMGGMQLASFVNMNAATTHGIQIASVANVSEGPMRGLQLAGAMNYAQDAAQGLQLGLGNVATKSEGAQAGLFNFAGDARGLQLGAANVSGTHSGVPIGLVNLSKSDGTIELVAFGSTLSAANAGVRTTVNRFQSGFSAGGIDLEGDVSTAAFLSWSYGYRFGLGGRWELGADLGFTHIMPEKSDDPADNDRLHFALLARVLPELRVSPRVGLFAGPGVTTIFNQYSSHARSETKLLVTAGLALKP